MSDEARIRILFLAASPAGHVALALDEEARAITEKLRLSDHGRRFELIQAPAARREDLIELLNRHRPHIVHFSGHGGVEGLYFKGADGQAELAPAAAVEQVFAACRDRIRLVVLNACLSVAQAEAITRHIDCAVGMSAEIGDRDAQVFAAQFYSALGYGRDVAAAFGQAKAAVHLQNLPDHAVPRLMARPGVKPAEIKFVPPEQKPAAPTPKAKKAVTGRKPADDLRRWRDVRPYAVMAGVCLLFSTALLLLLIFQSERLAAGGLAGRVFYFVLVPLGLSVALTLFGVLRSVAKWRGHAFGHGIELGGPAAAAALTVAGGFLLAPDGGPFAQTVFVHGPGGRQDLVLRNEGRVMLDLGREREEAAINERGEAFFPSIAASFRGRRVPVLVQADGWRLQDTQAVRVLNGEAAYVAVEPLDAVIIGTVLRPDGVTPFPDVAVSVAGVGTTTDSAGRFRLPIPGAAAQDRLELHARMPGHRDYRTSVSPRGGPVDIVLRSAADPPP